MKRLFCIALSVVMVLSILAACGGNSNEQVDNDIAGVFSVGYAKADITPSASVPLRTYVQSGHGPLIRHLYCHH